MKWPFVTRKKFMSTWTELLSEIEDNNKLCLENMRLKSELDACWKCINARSNKGHWTKQKRVNGRFAK